MASVRQYCCRCSPRKIAFIQWPVCGVAVPVIPEYEKGLLSAGNSILGGGGSIDPLKSSYVAGNARDA